MSAKQTKLSEEALEALAQATAQGAIIRLGPDQLDRKVYVEVDKALKAAGGKWNRKLRGHVFDLYYVNTQQVLDNLRGGSYVDRKKVHAQFESPEPVVERLMELADVQAGMKVLEPSAGTGNIVAACLERSAKVTAIEIQDECVEAMRRRFEHIADVTVSKGDFLEIRFEQEFDRVVMNPPFTRGADVDHVVRAWDFVAPGGRLVAVMSASAKSLEFSARAKGTWLYECIANYGRVEDLPEDSFEGTSVRTCVVVMDKPHRRTP